MADRTEDFTNIDLSEFTITSSKPSFYNDGDGVIRLVHNSDPNKNLDIIQRNCIINEAQVKGVYAFMKNNPHLQRPVIYNDESEDKSLNIAFYNEKTKKTESVPLAKASEYQDSQEENTDKPKTADDEFILFCKELKKGHFDVDTIKAGIEKFGLDQLSDSQKALFRTLMFPAPVPEGSKETEKLGFQNLSGINNTLKALQQLQQEGKVDNKQIVEFITQPNPQSGKSMLDVVAMNTYALEFKEKRIKDPQTREILYNNAQTMVEIQDTLKNFDADMLYEAFNHENSTTGRKIRYSDLAKKSFMMKDAYEKAVRFAAEHPQQPKQAEQTENTPDPVRFGGLPEDGNTLTFSAQPENLNVETNTPPQPNPQDDEEEEKSAQMEKPGRDSKHGSGGFDFQAVSEQDLIKYLYNVWFLGLINYGLKKTFQGADGLIDYLTGESGQIPHKSATATVPQNTQQAGNQATGTPPSATPPARNSQANTLSPAATGFLKQMQDISFVARDAYIQDVKRILGKPEMLAGLTKYIKQNIGKAPSKWKPVPGFNPANHQGFIAKLNNSYMADKDLFVKNMDVLEKNPKFLQTMFSEEQIYMCSYLATMDYVRKNPDKELVGNAAAAEKIRKDTLVKMYDMAETISKIYEQKEIDFKHEKNLDPNAKLSLKQQKDIMDAAAAEMRDTYLSDISVAGRNLGFKLCEHHITADATQKKLLEQEIRAQGAVFDKAYNKYREPEDEQEVQPRAVSRNTERMGMEQAAREERTGERKEKAWNQDIVDRKERYEADNKRNIQRKDNFNKLKNHTEHDTDSRQTGSSSRNNGNTRR